MMGSINVSDGAAFYFGVNESVVWRGWGQSEPSFSNLMTVLNPLIFCFLLLNAILQR